MQIRELMLRTYTLKGQKIVIPVCYPLKTCGYRLERESKDSWIPEFGYAKSKDAR